MVAFRRKKLFLITVKKKLIRTIPNRLKAVIANKDLPSKYQASAK